jgi:ribosome biogenesis GTPase
VGKKDKDEDSRKKKIRVSFRKNKQTRARKGDWTRLYQELGEDADMEPQWETVRAKGELSRRRTIVVAEGATQESPEGATPFVQAPPESGTWTQGRVLQVTGPTALVEAEDGHVYVCAISGVLRSVAIEERSPVVAGDLVGVRLVEEAISGPGIHEPQGMIERVEPRRTQLTRAYRGKEHVVVANVDQVVVVVTPAEPPLKLNLLDRYLVAAGQGKLDAVICLNKVDLVEPEEYQAILGLYAQLGYQAVATSLTTGYGLERLKLLLRGKISVLAGQSGVGKSSLINAFEPGLKLATREVSKATGHGRHTTTTVRLYRWSFGGWVVDTPGIRQFNLWNVPPEAIEGYYVEFRPYVPYCKFHSCTHTHEDGCAVKSAVARGEIDAGRYQRYCNLFYGVAEEAVEE